MLDGASDKTGNQILRPGNSELWWRGQALKLVKTGIFKLEMSQGQRN